MLIIFNKFLFLIIIFLAQFSFSSTFKEELYDNYENAELEDSYFGEFKNGKRDGLGQYKYADGQTTTGLWENNNIVLGVEKFPDGDTYCGEYTNDDRTGHAIYKFKKIGDTYAGSNKNGLRDGFGYYTFENGDYDIGEYKKDLLDGYVVRYYPNGSIFEEGKYKKDKLIKKIKVKKSIIKKGKDAANTAKYKCSQAKEYVKDYYDIAFSVNEKPKDNNNSDLLIANNSMFGNFEGYGIYDGEEYPIELSLFEDENGEIMGTYRHGEEEYEGTLYGGFLINKNKLKIYWVEGNDKGWFKLTFKNNYSTFNGHWGMIENNNEGPKLGSYYADKIDNDTLVAENNNSKTYDDINSVYCIGSTGLIYGPFKKNKGCDWGLLKLDGKYVSKDIIFRDAPVLFNVYEDKTITIFDGEDVEGYQDTKKNIAYVCDLIDKKQNTYIAKNSSLNRINEVFCSHNKYLDSNFNQIAKNNSKNNEINNQKDILGPQINVAETIIANEKLTAIIEGTIKDQNLITSLSIDGKEINFDINGKFSENLFVKPKGQTIEIVAIDKFSNRSSKFINLLRKKVSIKKNEFTFLDPRKLSVSVNNNDVALIIGIEKYENTFAAHYAENDALAFGDFANTSLGVPFENIKILINDNANRTKTLKTIRQWLPKKIKENQSKLYLFYSGHGLASEDGSDLYLLPADGDPELLEDSTILRSNLFNFINDLNPKSVTVFLDTCYSGATRSEELLVASRPIFIEAEEQEVPTNFTIFSASAGKETAKVLKEAEHGLFSYYMMKGLEGEADSNNDRTITNGELHAFINKNVSRQANQTPQLNGDPEQVIVEW